MLVEVMMSALLVALAATAVFKGIDGANATSGQSKARAIATTLAQEDQEALRSKDPRTLASYNPAPVQRIVNDVPYTITSTASFVSDRAESESCTKASGRVTYVSIKSTVTWPDMRGAKPVSAASVIAINNAYAKGSLSIRINDAHAAPVAGVGVSTTTPSALSGTTNSVGCLVWDGLNTGAYFGSFSKAGYVDPSGANVVAPVNGWNVTTGSTAVATHLYDQAGSVNFTFVGKSGSTVYPGARADGVTLSHPSVPAPGVRRANFTAASAYQFTGLFPFTTAYAASAGACAANTTAPGTTTSVIVPPGGLASPDPVVIEMPLINVRIRRTTGTTFFNQVTSNYQAPHVTVRPLSATCGGAVSIGPADANGVPTVTGAALAFPYGSYMVCADDNTRKAEVQVDLVDLAAGTAKDVVIPRSGTTGLC
jgi:hypothetical protein